MSPISMGIQTGLKNYGIIIVVLPIMMVTIVMIMALNAEMSTNYDGKVFAHRDGCHRWHSCPSDTGSYVCGDLGYDDQCPNVQKTITSNSNGDDDSDDEGTGQTTIVNTSNGKTGNSVITSVNCLGLADCFDGIVPEVVDGDTLDVNNVRIRLGLVDAPEVDESGYIRAKEFVEGSCGVGTHARVDEDDGQKGGTSGRIIAQVFCGNQSIAINHAILDSGHAAIYQEFCGVSEFASTIWGVKYCTGNTQFIESATETKVDSTQPDYEGTNQQDKDKADNCDRSYPDFCIKPSPPDLDCGDISQKRFAVTGSDPHGFDRDGDGKGCES